MKLTVLGSGSDGNGYVLHNNHEALIIECGKHYGMAMKAIAHDRKKVVGCIMTHEHGDHSRYVNEYLNAVIPVAMTQGTMDALVEAEKIKSPFLPVICRHRETLHCGNFEVTPFNVHHDAAEPVGFHIWHPDCGAIVFVTDSDIVAERFEPPQHIMIECNYDLDALQANRKLPQETKDRIIDTHMSYHHCVDTLRNMDLSRCRQVVLIHLSNDNSQEAQFVEGVRAATGKPVFAAVEGMELDFGTKPF